ncbi:AbrB/MazE/SpoVT family DNA-binding domain-containing protein [Salisediminibacterium beveridgei]|uniref:Addiction module antidote n=1 Tax=Salisediminibacterium beveridgei TaxID=632773 RepID=A0A1D7QUQ6_9BACI|nr:hypothetical protein [Salisediminibacterium beveridgei]AOM82746.1 hypothetical protein BBEV_1383 [Salisediminibacterium beveridgei]
MAKEIYNERIRKVQNEHVVKIPLEILEYLHAHQGDELAFQIDEKQVVIRPARKLDLTGLKNVEEDFTEGMRHVLERYDQTFRTLADKRGE